MSLLKNLFKSKDIKPAEPSLWKVIEKDSQLDIIVEKSYTKTQLIFKHSVRCGISRGVLNQFRAKMDPEVADFYYLDLLAHRDISNEIAARFGIIHQSPQLIVLKEGVVIGHDSHYDLLSLSY